MSSTASDFTRFVLLAHPRSGSNMLALSLQKHPRIRMYLELFNRHSERRQYYFCADQVPATWPLQGTVKPAARWYQDEEDPCAFLENAVFYPRLQGECDAVGYKLFYQHARENPNIRRLWKYLEDSKEIIIVHLTRSNLFHAFLSSRIAMETGQWMIRSADKRADLEQPIRIDPEQCGQSMRFLANQRDRAKAMFSGHPYLEISYEDLTANFSSALEQVQAILRTPNMRLPVVTKKQRLLDPARVVGNYTELVDYFRSSPYAEFFH